MDDTLIIFSEQKHTDLFLHCLNSKHPNINFTLKNEINNKISFLDIWVEKNNNSLATKIFRKPTFSGLGISYFSNTPLLYRLNSIRTLIHRAYQICSTYEALCSELEYLRNFFSNNGFPDHLFHKICYKYLNYKYNPPPSSLDVRKKVLYFSLPYYNKEFSKLASQLPHKLNNFFLILI